MSSGQAEDRRGQDFSGHAVALNWRALRLYNLYRLVISGLFAVLGIVGKLPPNLSPLDAQLFSGTALCFAASSIFTQYLIEQRLFDFTRQVFALSLIDLLAIMLLMHAAGGVTSGLGTLLVVSVAGTCLLASGRAGVFFAALASVAFLVETVFGVLALSYPSATYTQAGLLGAACFGTAVLASALAERARSSEVLAAQRAEDLRNLSRLNELIVARLQSGVLALEVSGEIFFMNSAARRFLGVQEREYLKKGHRLTGSMLAAFQQWRERGGAARVTVTGSDNNRAVATFAALESHEEAASGFLTFLEDEEEIRHRAQQMKLASLGRLTASIAHEVRNPLGAISHASQLLSEAETLDSASARMVQIILQHCSRMNTIIESILNLGRSQPPIRERFALLPWLDLFVEETLQRSGLAEGDISIERFPPSLMAYIDKSQLHQVLSNLVDNGLRYAQTIPRLVLGAGIIDATSQVYLEITDSGPGLPAEVAESVFEPFLTTEARGTGLGLFLSRELCEANGASLRLIGSRSGCCFRIVFSSE